MLRKDGAFKTRLCAGKVKSVSVMNGPPIANAIVDTVIEGGFLLHEMEDNQCRWPIGIDEDGKHRFCGEPKQQRSSYCAEHHKLAWVKHEFLSDSFDTSLVSGGEIHSLCEEAEEYFKTDLDDSERRRSIDDDPSQAMFEKHLGIR